MSFRLKNLFQINDIATESAEQDQTARMCSLILLYTFPKNQSIIASGSIMFDPIELSLREIFESKTFFLIGQKIFVTV